MASGELTEQDVEEEEQTCADWIELNRMEQEAAKKEKKKRLKEVKEEPNYASDGNATMADAQEEVEEEKPEEEEEAEEKPEEEKDKYASDGKDAEKPRRQWHSKARKEGTPATGGESGNLGEPEMADGKEKKASDGDNKKKKSLQTHQIKQRSPKDLHHAHQAHL